MNEQDSTSTTRIKPIRKAYEPIQINLEALESFREIEQPKRKAITK